MEIGNELILNTAFAERGLNNVVLWDVQNIKDGQSIKITFISTNSQHRQGIWLKTNKGIEIPSLENNVNKSINLWEDTAPKEIILKCHTTDGKLSIYNIWDEGDGKESQAYSSGMLINDKNGLLVYKCNDYGIDTDFSSLVFSLEKL